MYTIRKCSNLSDTLIYKAFMDSFEDYMIKINMDEEAFLKTFFGPEGNDKELSYVAFRGDLPVGLILGGIKIGESFKTLRCGGMAVIPSVRGTGLAKRLLNRHEQTASGIGCKQLFLEVIDSNERAIRFYRRNGYEKIYNLTYRSWELKEENPLRFDTDSRQIKVESMGFEDILRLRKIDHSHLPWQSDFPYFKNLPCHFYGIRDKDRLVAGLATTATKLYYLWVHPAKRQQGYAKALLGRVITDLKPEVLRVTYSNNSVAHTFANHYGMSYGKVNQLEMYKWLG